MFPMTWDVDGGGVGGGDRLAGIGEEASLASLRRLSRSMPDLAELRDLRHRIYEVRFSSPVSHAPTKKCLGFPTMCVQGPAACLPACLIHVVIGLARRAGSFFSRQGRVACHSLSGSIVTAPCSLNQFGAAPIH